MSNGQCVIFDLDGTLIDSYDTIVDNCRVALLQITGNITSFDFSLHKKRCLESLFQELATFEHIEYNVLKQVFDQAYSNNYLHKTSLFRTTTAMLDTYRQKGFSIIVLTNKRQLIAERICEELLPGKVDCIIGRNGDYAIKNKDNIFKRFTEMNVDFRQCVLYIGDTETDAKCAEYLHVPFRRI